MDQFPIIEALVEDVRRRVPAGRIAARFHNSVARILGEAALAAAKMTGINRVALSGGVFQNGCLSDLLDELSTKGLEVFAHREIPPNDACISLGQAWIGAQTPLEREQAVPAKEEHPLEIPR